MAESTTRQCAGGASTISSPARRSATRSISGYWLASRLTWTTWPSCPLGTTPRYCDLHLRPVPDADGEITGMLSAVVDVTTRYELDEQKDTFLALASHELKTPITTIKGYAQTGLRIVIEGGR